MSDTPGPGAFPPPEMQDAGADSPTKRAMLAHQQNLVDRQNLAERMRNLNRTTKETTMPPPPRPSVPPLQSRPSSRIVRESHTMEGDSEVASTDGGASTRTRLELPKNATFAEVQAARPERFGNNKGSIEWLEKKVDAHARDTADRYNELQQDFHSLHEDISQGFAQLSAKFESFGNRIGQLEENQRRQQQYHQPHARQPSEAFDEDQFREALNSLRRQKPQQHMPQPFRPVTPLQQQRRPSVLPEQFYRGYAPSPDPFRNARPPSRHDNENPREDRHFRETTHDTGGTGGSKSDSIKIKREEVGQFNPLYEDPDDLGVVADGKNLIYTDVHCFIDRINTFMEDATTRHDAERQILGMFQTLLGGSAVMWWTNELTAERRAQLRKMGLEYILQELRTRFDTDAGTATRRFNDGTVTLKDIAKDDMALSQYVQKMLRYARSAGLLNNNNSNWHGPMMTIWSNMDIKIRQYLRPPDQDDGQSLADYMRQVEKARAILLAAAHDIYPQYAKKKPGKSSSSKPDEPTRDSSYKKDRSSREERREHRERRREEDYRRGSYRRWRDRSRVRREERSSGYGKREEDRDRDRNRDRDRRDTTRYRDDKRDYKDRKHRDRDRVHFAEGSSGSDADESDSTSTRASSSQSSDNDSGSEEVAHIVIDANLTCHKCHRTFTTRRDQKRHVKVCEGSRLLKHERRALRNALNPSRRTCGFCSSLFPTRSQLFQHLKTCEDAKNGTLRRPTDPASLLAEAEQQTAFAQEKEENTVFNVNATTDNFIVKEAPEPTAEDTEDPTMTTFTHLRVAARTSPDAEDVEVCLDPGASKSIIDATFLQALEHKVENRAGKVKGVNGKAMRLSQWATFTIYLVGSDNGQATLMKFRRSAWVVPNLAPNLLLGNDFMDPYKADIDYGTKEVRLGNINFVMPFQTRALAYLPCRRKVRTKRAVTLLPQQEAYVPVRYKPLPEGRNLAFYSKHAAALSAIVTAKTPHVVALKNPTSGIMTIPSQFPIGYISECEDSGYFVSSWDSAFPALSVGSALPHFPSDDFAFAFPAVNDEFVLDDKVRAVADGFRPHKQPFVGTATQQGEATPVKEDSEPARKPHVPEKHSTLGLKMSGDAPEVTTKDGVRVYAADPQLAQRFVRICESFPKLWRDEGLIKVPPDELMRVPLVEGWQNQKIKSRMYPLSSRDREVLDKVFNELHRQGKMVYATKPTPFAHPVFVVWRTVKGQQKGRVVIDLRALNRVTVPDNYPLPLQSEIIAALRGKKFITAIDATSFFYQFGIHPPHRDRFTLISPRGLEQPTVALMGFRNSPAHVQRFMDRLLDKHSHYCKAFIDDIVIFSDNAEQHEQHLKTIFRLFLSKNIAISPAKSYVAYPDVELLGFRVNSLGLTTTKERVAAFRNLAFPDSLKALEQYLGASGFLRHLIPYFAKLSEPLQIRKTALLALGRKTGQVVPRNTGKRNAYTTKTFFKPTDAELLSFEAIQHEICKDDPTILYHFDPDKVLFLQVDACTERGFGVMVFHLADGYIWVPGTIIPSNKVRPIMFLSRCLTGPETRYGPSEQEVACLVWAVKKLRTMIHSSNHPVVVLTDHAATKGIVEKSPLTTTSTERSNRRLICAAIYLSEYNLQIYHLPGRLNFVPDALSRLKALQDKPKDPKDMAAVNSDDVVLDNIFFAYAEAQMDEHLKQQFAEGYQKDAKYAAIVKDLREAEKQYQTRVARAQQRAREQGRPFSAEDSALLRRPGLPFVMIDGLLYNIRADGTRALCVPRGEVLKRVLAATHDEKHHFGEERMLYDLRGLSISNKTHVVKSYVKHCPVCQLNATDRQPPIGNYQPVRPSDTLPMRVIAIDFIVGLPAVKAVGTPWQLENKPEYDTLLTVSCKSSKRTLLLPGHSTYTAEDWGRLLLRHLLLSDWGVPTAIISDRDRKFTSSLWKGMWKQLGTQLLMTTAYHPQADGLAERKNQTVEIAIRFHTFEHPESNWLEVLPSLQWHLNSGLSGPVKTSPHELLFGFRPTGPLEAMTKPLEDGNQDTAALREHLRHDAQLAMDFAAAQAKRRYDGKHRPIEFEVGDKVYLRLHRGYHLPGNPSRKYSQQRAGPFVVKKRVGRLAYELDFPPNMGIHPVISVAHLSPTPPGEDPFDREIPPPGPVDASQQSSSSASESGDSYEVEAVLQHKKVRNGYKYLIKWKGWGHEHNVWKTEQQLRHSQRLVNEYWERQGGRPGAEQPPTEAPRRRGRPRKDDRPRKDERPPQRRSSRVAAQQQQQRN